MITSNEALDATGTQPRQELSRVIRAISLGAGPAAAPLAATAFDPVLGAALLAAELVFVLIVFGIAVYGPQEQVDRVFRLLRWLRNRPEPPAPIPAHHGNLPYAPAYQPVETTRATKDARRSATGIKPA
jgi:hypothetical protein